MRVQVEEPNLSSLGRGEYVFGKCKAQPQRVRTMLKQEGVKGRAKRAGAALSQGCPVGKTETPDTSLYET